MFNHAASRCFMILLILPSASSYAEDAAVRLSTASDPLLSAMPDHESGRLKEIVSDLVRNNIPEDYTNDKSWGQQKRIYAGVKIWWEDGNLETKRRWTQVNHGAWSRYQIQLIDPNESLNVHLTKLGWLADGTARFEIVISGVARCYARRSQWNYGLRLWSVSAHAEGQISLTIGGTISPKMDFAKLPPDVLIQPKVDAAKIAVSKFEVQRISKVGGDVAEGIGDGLEAILKHEIIDRQQEKLVAKLNKQIRRKQDALRLSMSDWMADLLKESESQKQQGDGLPPS